MEDDLDNATKEMDLPVKKKAGRPSCRVTRRNFFELRAHFDRKYGSYLPNAGAKHEEFYSLVKVLPSREIKQAQIDRVISSYEKQIRHAEDFDREPSKYTLDELKTWKKQKPEPLTDEHISAFQVWVDKHISKDEWAKIGAVIRQKRHKNGNGDCDERIKQLPVKANTFRRLEKLKNEMGSDNWDYALSKMATLSREALKTRATKKAAAEKRKRTMARP